MKHTFLSSRKGYTLIELMLTAALVAIIALVISEVFFRVTRYFQSISVRQQLQSEGDRTMNTIFNALQQAQAHTVAICSCNEQACSPTCPGNSTQSTTPPYDRIEFVAVGQTAPTTIYWSNNSVFMAAAGGGPLSLANGQVTSLIFTGDATDFSRVWVSIRLDAPSPIPTQQTQTVLIPNLTVRLAQ